MKNWIAKLQKDKTNNFIEYKIEAKNFKEAAAKAIENCRKDHKIALLISLNQI